MTQQNSRDDKAEKKGNILSDIKSFLIGDKSKVMYLSSDGEDIMSFPWLFIVLFMLVFDVPSWIIATLLLFLIIFDLDLNIRTRRKTDVIKKATVAADKYKQNKAPRSEGRVKEKNGFYEYRI